MRLTRTIVRDLKLTEGKSYEIVWDEGLPGFGVRINPTGKAWVVQYRANGKSRRETIGRTDTISLDGAREAARTKLAHVRLGADPYAERKEAAAQKSITLRIVVDKYLANASSRLKPRSFEETRRNLLKHWASLHETPITAVTRASVSQILETIGRNSGPIASNRARAALSAVFSYAMKMGLVDHNAVVGSIKAGDERHRDRVLTDPEVKHIWQALKDDSYGRIVRILLLTGQRREEVANMRWPEIDLKHALWTLPGERTKNRRAHEVPLSPPVVTILEQIPRILARDLVFGARGGGYSGWSKSKAFLDERMKKNNQLISDWRLHDLRRTAATGMANIGSPPHIVEAVLNHISGTRAGVAGIYNRATYRQEKREALDLWANHVSKIAKLT